MNYFDQPMIQFSVALVHGKLALLIKHDGAGSYTLGQRRFIRYLEQA